MKHVLKRHRFLCSLLCITAVMLFCASPTWAQSFSMDLSGEGGSVSGRAIQLIALLTVLSLAPAILMMVTSFTRIVVVLSFLRSALGVQQTPPNVVMISLALFLTGFIMAPTFQQAYKAGINPLLEEEMEEVEAVDKAMEPFKVFMLKHVREQDLTLFIDIMQDSRGGEEEGAKELVIEKPEDTPLRALIPAFMISELKRAFEIGFLLFVPFLIIDMVVASILMSMGMMMLPPVIISLPFKLIFFVLVDGWYLIAGSLIQSYNI